MAENAYTITSVFQYATLFNMPDAIAAWNNGDTSESADSLFSLFGQMGGECDEPSFSIQRFFNLVGQRGWELVHIQDGESGTTYIFKRRYERPA